nr:amidase family protein [Bordetella sp. BOR01]
MSCEQLVSAYLARIEAYNLKGPALRAILTVNPHALELARSLDAKYASDPAGVGSLHCVPIVLKDNFDTADMPTSSGNVAMRDSRPQKDAFTVARMRQAGALILAKSNLQEFARGGVSISSLGGQVLNPYDLSRNPGGSSGGTGAALAANMALVGTGSDTGQSIRSPSSANSLVGVRPTRGLISRAGVMPNSFTQDEIGPIARTVTDAAKLLDVMVGYDPADPITALGVGKAPKTYTAALDANALQGATIGVLTNLLGTEARHAEVTQAVNAVADTMQHRGARIVRFDMPDLADLTGAVATDKYEAHAAFDKYFAGLPSDAPIKSFRQLVDTKSASPAIQKAMENEIAIVDGMQSDEYKTHMLNREKLRIALAAKMAELGIDAILYPMQSILVTEAGRQDQPERNGVLSNATGMPAVTFQAGFSKPADDAPIGVPIGAELLGRDYTEATLLGYAYAFEQAAHVRKPPLSTPALK